MIEKIIVSLATDYKTVCKTHVTYRFQDWLAMLINLISVIYRSRNSHHRCSIKIGVLRNFTKFTGKHLCQSLSLNKVAVLSPATLSKKRLCHRCFPVNFVKFLRIPFLQNTCGRLLL